MLINITWKISFTLCSLSRSKGIFGKEETPYLLKRITEMTKGQSLDASKSGNQGKNNRNSPSPM